MGVLVPLGSVLTLCFSPITLFPLSLSPFFPFLSLPLHLFFSRSSPLFSVVTLPLSSYVCEYTGLHFFLCLTFSLPFFASLFLYLSLFPILIFLFPCSYLCVFLAVPFYLSVSSSLSLSLSPHMQKIKGINIRSLFFSPIHVPRVSVTLPVLCLRHVFTHNTASYRTYVLQTPQACFPLLLPLKLFSARSN